MISFTVYLALQQAVVLYTSPSAELCRDMATSFLQTDSLNIL